LIEFSEVIVKNTLKFAVPLSGALLAASLLGPASPALADSTIACDSNGNCDAKYEFNSWPEVWTVPNEVHEVLVYVAGGSGADSLGGAPGGAGGSIAGWVDVTPGERLAVVVGGGHIAHSRHEAYGGGGRAWDVNDGAGGGGSFVFINSGDDSDPWEPLLIAGGGGGGANYSVTRAGGAGGFAMDESGDAEPAVADAHAAGATTSSGNPDGGIARFNGAVFYPGEGVWPGSGGAGGGGYYGGVSGNNLGGGGGSGYASSRVDLVSGSFGENLGTGVIELHYVQPLQSEAALEVLPTAGVVGQPITLTGTVSLADGGAGTVTFTSELDGDEVLSQSRPVVIDQGVGPFTGSASVTFTPNEPGEYTFFLNYSGDSEHGPATAQAVVVTVSPASVPPGGGPEPTPTDELADTGSDSQSTAILGALALALIGGGAILSLVRRRRTAR